MFKEIILMSHPTFGVLAMLAAGWVFVDTLNANEKNRQRIKKIALASAIFLWLSFLLGGYWYVQYYGVDKAIIKAGPWPFAHSVIMEVKEHVFFILLLIGTYLPIVTADYARNGSSSAQRLILWTSALMVALILVMEGSGAVVALATKLGLGG